MAAFKAWRKRSAKRPKRGAGSRPPGANPNNPPVPLLRPFTWSMLGHAAVIAFMLIGFAGRTQTSEPAFGTIAIDGVVLDDEAVRREIQRLDELERAAVTEREREVEQLRRQIEQQQQRQKSQERELSALSSRAEEARRTLNEQQNRANRQLSELQQRQQAEAERLARVERERRQEEERARTAEAQRQQAEEEARKLSEEAQAAQRRLQETERRKREAELAEKMRREMQEERRRQAVESGLLDQYKARIRQKIESNWVRPPATREDLVWVVSLDMLPGNEVAGIRFEQFNGTDVDRRSIEAAIRRSSPLPEPPEPELFERRLRLRYPPQEPG